MKAKPSEHRTRRFAPFLAISFGFAVLLSSTGICSAADLLKWDVTGTADTTGSAIASAPAAGISGSVLNGGGDPGSMSGGVTSPSNTWNRTFPTTSNFTDAQTLGYYLSFTTTAASGYTVSISGITGLNLARTAAGPTSAGLFYSTNGGGNFTQTGSTFTVGTSLASAASNFATAIAVTPIVITGGNELPGADRDKDGIKKVVVTIPRALALGSKLFARQNVVVP